MRKWFTKNGSQNVDFSDKNVKKDNHFTYHQEQASNRDRYVEIIWDNIENMHLHQFVKIDKKAMPDYGIEYDYDSIMHSPRNVYSKNVT